MSDLISRQALCDYALNQKDKSVTPNDIMRFPSAQPEIIRCKDCAKREYCRTSTVWAVAPNDDWYCADAERRTDE